jgi:hypothetical protein
MLRDAAAIKGGVCSYGYRLTLNILAHLLFKLGYSTMYRAVDLEHVSADS